MRLGVDCSNYTGILDDAKVRTMADAGVEWAIVGTQKPDITRLQIIALEARGIEVPAVYCFLYWDGHDPTRVAYALSFDKPVWLDCEYVTDPMPAPDSIVGNIRNAVAMCGQSFAGIYTGYWWWPKYAANYFPPIDVAPWPLWHADYRPRPESLVLPHPYGGWTKATIWQWSSAGLGGVNVDLNVMEDAPVPDPQPTPPPQPTEVEALRALVNAGAIIAAGDQNLADLSEKNKSDLEWIAKTARGA